MLSNTGRASSEDDYGGLREQWDGLRDSGILEDVRQNTQHVCISSILYEFTNVCNKAVHSAGVKYT
jgi:hypothetical protein